MTAAKLSGPMLRPASGGAPKQVMVLLHGYGADGADLLSLGYEWRALWPDMLFVAPNAPTACAANPAGFERFPLGPDRIAGRIVGAEMARPVIAGFLAELWAQTGLGPADTVLVGFSQGAMMALHVGLGLQHPLPAIVAFSGGLVPPEGPHARSPVALVHGDADVVVAPDLSREAAQVLGDEGFDVALHLSPGVGHGIAPDGLAFATEFLVARLSKAA